MTGFRKVIYGFHGAEGRTRTGDLLITNQLLYQLSYFGLCVDCIVAPLIGKVSAPPSALPLDGVLAPHPPQCKTDKSRSADDGEQGQSMVRHQIDRART